MVYYDISDSDLNFVTGANSVFLETSRYDPENYRSFIFLNPISILEIYSINEVDDLFRNIEYYLNQGYYLAGYFTYECGYHFENIVKSLTYKNPIAWIGVYHDPLIFNHLTGVFEQPRERNGDLVPDNRRAKSFTDQGYHVNSLRFNYSNSKSLPLKPNYFAKIAAIKKYIQAGDVYQINFTGKFNFNFTGSQLAFYQSLKPKQKVSYGAFIQTEHCTVLSFSPELFLRRNGDHLTAKPMKGTVTRGKTIREDQHLAEWLRNDEKSRAENLMIVDLLRNDLGKISEIGTVAVTDLFSIEKYNTLFQMTSTIQGKLKNNTGYYEIFKALFPCGSVTGAPKIRAMEIIRELEADDRGVYTGAIGFFSPFKEAVFNIAIRTISIKGNHGEMGSGGGIVWDSIPEAEYEECELKAKFLAVPFEDFELIESIKWHNDYRMPAKHMERLVQSAQYFDFAFDVDSIQAGLVQNLQNLEKGKVYKVRLKLNHQGKITIENILINETAVQSPLLVAISELKTDSNDQFLYHKTTRRKLYDQLYRKASEQGFADVLFRNEREQITEGAISNVFIKKNGYLITPPIACGLLNGVYRRYLLETQAKVREEELYLEDLLTADAIYICNAIRGLREVKLNLGL
jgi:para-aminobenzoate synthetase/4-amino-4-deoxychorismate lyase